LNWVACTFSSSSRSHSALQYSRPSSAFLPQWPHQSRSIQRVLVIGKRGRGGREEEAISMGLSV